MQNLGASPGEILRWLRNRRGLTLEQAARLLHTSAPVLSRKERGIAVITPDEVQTIISALRLDARESYLLVTAAGFLPAAFPNNSTIDLQLIANTLLPHIAFPAVIVDDLLYLRAWNRCAQAIFGLPEDGVSVAHPINILFAPQLRARLGGQWEPYVDGRLRSIQERTLLIRRRADYQRMLDTFVQRYGAQFTERWYAAQALTLEEAGAATQRLANLASLDGQDGSAPSDDLANILVYYPTAVGNIEFLLTRAALHFSQSYELDVYLPYGPENSVRYEQLRATLGPEQVCFGADPN